ncbi:regulatory LuxR family protein [Kutzneria buriramensis]|uniref:Regulatory LuxR family protein n=2 Tax=Kutzneria buriramensis TaxID=1045776 RepID=A0A3E0HIM9_9PSEU|nr:regulatory LuxR family protein [Kutzneria buriramensis]
MAGRMMDIIAAAAWADVATQHGLSLREREVLVLSAAGSGTSDIARRLHLSVKIVRNRVSAVLAKLGMPDRAWAIAWARSAGLGPPEDGR